MQAGTIEPTTSVDYSQKSRQGKQEAAPVVGASGANASAAESSGAQVELQIVAINLASAVSAAAEPRAGEPAERTAERPASPPFRDQGSRSAANLKLSAEAQRLALIPAQVMAPDEIAAARAEVVKAQEELNAVRSAERRDAKSEAIADANERAQEPLSLRTRELSVPEGSSAMRAEVLPAETRSSAEAAPAAAPPQNERETNAASETEAAPASATVPSERRPDARSALTVRSPFESSTPGSTGQSVDIVVGDAE